MTAPPALGQMLGGVGAVANSALFRSAVKNWWVTAPLGYAAYVLIRERQRKKQLTVPNVVSDLVPMVTLVATLVILNNVIEQREANTTSAAPGSAKPPLGPIRDASFTPTQPRAPLPGIPVGT